MPKRKDRRLQALELGRPVEWTAPEGGDLASMLPAAPALLPVMV